MPEIEAFAQDRQPLCRRLLGFLWRQHCWHVYIEDAVWGRCKAKRQAVAWRCCQCAARSFKAVI